jgi:hypothetical protein
MAIEVSINGNKSGEGFLIAPNGETSFPFPISLKSTTAGSVNATLNIAASGVQVELSKSNVIIGPNATTVRITAKSASRKKNDITLEVKVRGRVVASLKLTSIANPQVRFQGRFQARFATDGDFYNSARGGQNGWTWSAEGEPDFVPAQNNVPTKPGMAVGRVVRFQDAVALRSHVAPIGVKVTAIQGQVGKTTVSFTQGDPVIGKKVSLGPNSYLASNRPRNPRDPKPFENWPAGQEPIENFELHIENMFSGKSASLQDRPKSPTIDFLSPAEVKEYKIIPLDQFSTQRKNELLTDYHKLSVPDRTGTAKGRNLATRISHLGGSEPDNIPSSISTLDIGWSGKEEYIGLVNSSVQVNPGRSVVLNYLSGFDGFRFFCKFFNFHSDELCGRIDGTLQGLTPALQRLHEG